MKVKMLCLILIIFLLNTTFMFNVKAYDYGADWEIAGCTTDKKGMCVPLCRYSLKKFIEYDENYNRVYQTGSVYIYYKNGVNIAFSPLNESKEDDYGTYQFRMLRDASNIVYFRFKKGDSYEENRMDEWTVNNLKCPEYAYIASLMDESLNESYKSVCFDDDGESCQYFNKNFVSVSELKNDSDYSPVDTDEKNIVDNKFSGISLEKNIMSSYTCDMFDKEHPILSRVSKDLSKHIISSFIRDFSLDYDTITVNNEKYRMQFLKLRSGIDLFSKNCIQNINDNKRLSDEEKKEKILGFEYTEEQLNESLKIGATTKPDNDDEPTCQLLPKDVLTLLNNILNYIKYLGPILVIVITIIDLIKASVSGDSGEMKKVSEKFIKRLIAAILLFFIPVIIGLLFNLFDLTLPNCGI